MDDAPLPPLPVISLTEEQKALLNQAVDARVARILMQIAMEQAAAERALKAKKKPPTTKEDQELV